jgi:hypothetical protein
MADSRGLDCLTFIFSLCSQLREKASSNALQPAAPGESDAEAEPKAEPDDGALDDWPMLSSSVIQIE